MPQKIGNVDRSTLINAILPSATKTYTVISHQYAIKTIEEAFAKNNFEIVSEEFKCTADAKVAHGTFIINYQGDSDLEMMYTFSNSYDKSLRFRATIGAHVKINNAFMISNADSWLRKHTGTADNEAEILINEHIEHAEEYFKQLNQDKENMKAICNISKGDFGKIIGELFINGFLGTDQISLIKKEYENPSFSYNEPKDNLWTCYNFIIHALKQSHPSKWMINQLTVHLFFITKYNIVKFDDEETSTKNVSSNTETNTETNQEQIIPGIHDGVEELLPLLPGFGPPVPVTEVVEEIFKNPAQLDIEDVIKQVIDQTPEAGDANNTVNNINEPKESVNPEADEISQENLEAAADKFDQLNAETKAEEKGFVEQSKPLLEKEDTPETPVQNTITEESLDDIYFMQDEYPDVQIGNVLEIDNKYYEIKNNEQLEDIDYWVCKEVSMETEEEKDEDPITQTPSTLDQKEPAILDAESSKEATQVKKVLTDASLAKLIVLSKEDEGYGSSNFEEEIPKKQPDLPSFLPENHNAEMPVAEKLVEESLEEVDPLEKELIVPEQASTDLSEDDSPIKKVITDELEDIYGYAPEFTYILSGNQYNIVLESGESIVLSAAYIDSMKK